MVTAVFLFSNAPLVGGWSFPIWDASTFYAPAYMLVADFAQAGELLLWNPWTLGGSPDAADIQVGAFSPVTVGLGWLTGGTMTGFRLYWLFVWWLAGLGTLLLARHLRVPSWGAGGAALAFVSCGFFTGHGEHTSFLYGLSFLPFIVWRADAAMSERRLLPAVQAGALWGLGGLAGYPAMTILNGMFAGFWIVGRLVFANAGGETTERVPERRCGARRAGWAAGLLSVIFVCGVLVIAPAYYAFFVEGRGYSDRVEPLSRERAITSNALHPGAIATFASPYLTVVHFVNKKILWQYTDASTVSVYLCATFLLLAVVALWNRPGCGFRWWLFAGAAFFLFAAMGHATPLRGWLFDYVPPFRYFRHAGLMRGYAVFSLIVLAMYACRDFYHADGGAKVRRLLWRLAVTSGVWTALALGTLHNLSAKVKDPYRLGDAIVWAAFLWLAPGLCAGATLLLRRKVPGAWRLLPWALLALCALDAWRAITFPYNVTRASDPATHRLWAEISKYRSTHLDLTEGGLGRIFQSPLTRRGNRHQVIKQPSLMGYSPFNNIYMRDWLRDETLADLAVGQDRVWFAPLAAEATPDRNLFRVFREAVRQTGRPVLLLHPDEADREEAAAAGDATRAEQLVERLPKAERLAVRVRSYKPRRLAFEADCPADGWLLVTDRYANGWWASVNGRRTAVHRADFLFRAIEVRQGHNTVVFSYRPAGYPWLLIVSWLFLSAVGSFSLEALARRPAVGRTGRVARRLLARSSAAVLGLAGLLLAMGLVTAEGPLYLPAGDGTSGERAAAQLVVLPSEDDKPEVGAPRIFSDDFESGMLSTWTAVRSR